MIISVIGENNASPENALLAQKVGSLLAKFDVTVVCGGQGGVMRYACKGAKEMGVLLLESYQVWTRLTPMNTSIFLYAQG